MRTRVPSHRPGRQGGWVGLVCILIALAIVAWLSKDALMKYGMLPGTTTTSTERTTGGAAPATGTPGNGAGPG